MDSKTGAFEKFIGTKLAELAVAAWRGSDQNARVFPVDDLRAASTAGGDGAAANASRRTT